MAERPVRVLTVGTGAIGAIYSWRLSKSCNVTTVCRSNYDAVREKGFSIDSSKFGKEVFIPDQVVKTVDEAAAEKEPFDYIVITTKALPEVMNVAEIIAPAVSEKTTIVLIQNGLGVEEPITTRFPSNPIVSIVAYIGTSQTAPGQITMFSQEYLQIGEYKAAPVDSEQQREKLIELLEKGGVDVKRVDDVERVRWQKLFWNASFSSVCTLTGLNTSEVMANKEAMASVRNGMLDVIRAANAMGYSFDEEEQYDAMVATTKKTALNYKPSMQLDYERGQPMEVEVILGTPLRRAKAKGLQVPHLETLHDLCSALNSRALNKKK